MFSNLLIKYVKTDSDYKKMQIITYIISLIVLSLIPIAQILIGDLSSESIWGFIIGMAIMFLAYAIALVRELSDPVKLRAARIKATDERRKQLEQEMWANLGKFMVVILIILLVSSMWQNMTLNFRTLTVLLYGILFYRLYKLKK
jgi:predicted lysophospholipase L1 biosynthesis ABC-type transport system permease subunit